MAQGSKIVTSVGGPQGLVDEILKLEARGCKVDRDKTSTISIGHYLLVWQESEDESQDEGDSGNELLDALDELTKKDELLTFANQNDVEVPEYCKMPAQIKKYLKAVLSGEEEAAPEENADGSSE